jgi:hypothetical protein
MNLGYRWVSKIGKKEIGSPLGDIIKWEIFQYNSDLIQIEKPVLDRSKKPIFRK